MTHSGLQKQVLSLYRSLLRLAQQKQPQLMEHIRGEFRREAAVRRTDVSHIEWLIRRGHKQLAMFQHPNVKRVDFRRTS